MRAAERRAFVASLSELGPTAPTLCDPWRALDIASHIVVAEQYGGATWAAAWPLRRVVGPAVATAAVRRMEPAMRWAMGRAERHGWPWLLDRLRSGPPRLFGVGALPTVRLLEDWIHHEDLRRANGRGPRPADPELDRALAGGVELLAGMPEFADARRHVVVRLPDGRSIGGGGTPAVRIDGRPGEALLVLAGRGEVADVTIEGDRSLLTAEALAF